MTARAARARRGRWARGKKSIDPSARDIASAAKRARRTLHDMAPSLSAKRPAGRVMVGAILFLLACCLLHCLFTPIVEVGWGLSLSAISMFAIARLMAAVSPLQTARDINSGTALDLVPEWSILIALYKEADSVPSLLAALAKLEWDPKRLDIIFACERDDHETFAVLQAMRGLYRFRIVRVPQGGPRTKPNALQTALPFVRGRFVSVYDAEDRPDPRQLRAAFHALTSGNNKLAVVQAPLVTWNHKESWIAAQFSLDYAIWFRVMLPFFARLSPILPLGGTSNHFCVAALREVGGWDPYNVTEDADLGIRLGRLGYHAGLIDPPTYEEAPPRTWSWIKQRGRWIQGHMQTVSVHLRRPRTLLRQVGIRGFVAILIGLGLGPLAGILALPVGVQAMYCLFDGQTNAADMAILMSMASQVLAGRIAIARDGRCALWWAIWLQPLYFSLQTIAAARAMWRVVFTPSFWDKTDHGCAARGPKKPI